MTTADIAAIRTQLEMQRLLLLQLYKESRLADPNLGTQLAYNLPASIRLPKTNLMTSHELELNADSIKEELKAFFTDLEKMIELVRHQSLQLPPT
ncbi:hypothetical protein [Duganella sp. BuS-21]|uniref:hypothetical protein n=1 Tax=Duganella sp. BuS-21 TaxID=2943848 RepID=UPI0035A6314C